MRTCSKTLDEMDAGSRRGFAFNCLTSYSDAERMQDYLYYADPRVLFDHCKTPLLEERGAAARLRPLRIHHPGEESMKPVLIFGAGEIAEVAHFYFTRDTRIPVAGFTVDAAYLKESRFCGLPVVPFEEAQSAFAPGAHDLFVALSYAKINAVRAQKCAEGKARGYRLASYVSSKASVWDGFQPGENCFILEDNTLQPFVRIGDNVTLWSGNHIGHHARVGDRTASSLRTW